MDSYILLLSLSLFLRNIVSFLFSSLLASHRSLSYHFCRLPVCMCLCVCWGLHLCLCVCVSLCVVCCPFDTASPPSHSPNFVSANSPHQNYYDTQKRRPFDWKKKASKVENRAKSNRVLVDVTKEIRREKNRCRVYCWSCVSSISPFPKKFLSQYKRVCSRKKGQQIICLSSVLKRILIHCSQAARERPFVFAFVSRHQPRSPPSHIILIPFLSCSPSAPSTNPAVTVSCRRLAPRSELTFLILRRPPLGLVTKSSSSWLPFFLKPGKPCEWP